jgi:hypothetical protein
MQRLGVQRITGLGAVQTTSNITSFEQFFDNKSFSLVRCCYLIAMLGLACASNLKRLCREIAPILNYCWRVFDRPPSDVLLRKSLFQSADSSESLVFLRFKTESLLYAPLGRAGTKTALWEIDSCESFWLHHLWAGYLCVALWCTRFLSGLFEDSTSIHPLLGWAILR